MKTDFLRLQKEQMLFAQLKKQNLICYKVENKKRGIVIVKLNNVL